MKRFCNQSTYTINQKTLKQQLQLQKNCQKSTTVLPGEAQFSISLPKTTVLSYTTCTLYINVLFRSIPFRSVMMCPLACLNKL